MFILAQQQRAAVCRDLNGWIDEVARLTQPQIVHCCTGTESERVRLRELMLREGSLLALNAGRHPASFLARTQVQGVDASRRLLCTRTEYEAGPNNGWADPVYMQSVLGEMLSGCMQGRVLYVIPYLLGVPGNPLAQAGVQLTDSPLVALITSMIARVGRLALAQIRKTGCFVRGIHTLGAPDSDERLLCHFAEDDGIVCYGSNYPDDAVFALSAHSRRMAGIHARRDGWFTEHMSVLKVTSPDGEATYIGVCGSSGTGKTTLSTLVPPDLDVVAGWQMELVSDDVTWLQWDKNGQLRALNPLVGLCGTIANTNSHTCQNLKRTLHENVLFTNVGLTEDRCVWWDEADVKPPQVCTDWSGRQWTPSSSRPAAHWDARYVVPLSQCPVLDPQWSDPAGVPLSAIVFTSRRRNTIPLVHEATSWQHGVLMGATLNSERSLTPSDAGGSPLFDPFGQRADCPYHLADHWQHWLNQEQRAGVELPRIYHANWFRRDWSGRFLWPGYRENFRVLKWIVERSRGRGDSVQTPIGVMPTAQGLGLTGLGWTRETARALLEVSSEEWHKELDERDEFLARFSTKLPPELMQENETLRKRMRHARHELSGNAQLNRSESGLR